MWKVFGYFGLRQDVVVLSFFSRIELEEYFSSKSLFLFLSREVGGNWIRWCQVSLTRVEKLLLVSWDVVQFFSCFLGEVAVGRGVDVVVRGVLQVFIRFAGGGYGLGRIFGIGQEGFCLVLRIKLSFKRLFLVMFVRFYLIVVIVFLVLRVQCFIEVVFVFVWGKGFGVVEFRILGFFFLSLVEGFGWKGLVVLFLIQYF